MRRFFMHFLLRLSLCHAEGAGPGTKTVFQGLARKSIGDPRVAFISAEFFTASPW